MNLGPTLDRMAAQEEKHGWTLGGIRIESTPETRALLKRCIAGEQEAVDALGAMVAPAVVQLADTELWVAEDGA